LHFVTMAHQLAWMEHPAIWLCESCAILWLVLRVVRSPLVRTGVLLMLCGLGMNALVTDTNAGSMPVSECRPQCVQQARCGRVRHFKRGCQYWQIKHGSDCLVSATSLCSAGILIVAICLRQTLERARQEVRKKTDYSGPFLL